MRPGEAIRRFAVLASGALIAACGPVRQDPTGAISVTLRPGETGSCVIQPCEVRLVMPSGSGHYQVTANRVKVGAYPAGQTVSVGSFYETQAIRVEKPGVPPAYVYVPSTR
jgi:hypothetical protein